jgi:GDPmannose 4,6-dehydratase
MPECAIITGQDGSYFAELLLSKGYMVHGVMRRSSSFKTDGIDHLYPDPHEPDVRLHLHEGDLTDGSAIARLVRQLRPEEIYNLGAQSHVAASWPGRRRWPPVDAGAGARVVLPVGKRAATPLESLPGRQRRVPVGALRTTRIEL